MPAHQSRHSLALYALLGLFVLRVLAQALIALGYGSFLPPWEEWFSGVVPYPLLLASQLVIVVLMLKVCLDVTRQTGVFGVPNGRLGSLLHAAGSLYLVVMLIRYGLRMAFYPPERWTGGSIPIFFHWVLASFLLVVAHYHRDADDVTAERSTRARVLVAGGWALAAAGVLVWVSFQLAPAALAGMLDARPPENAVRVERGVETSMRDGVTLRSDVYRPARVEKTPTILVRIPFSKTFQNSLFASIIGRFWAEHGYTVVIQGTRGRYESEGQHTPLVDEERDGSDTLAWLTRQPWFDGRLGMWGGSAFGYTQWVLANQLPVPDGRSALMVQISSTDMHRMFYPGGAFSLASALFWAVRSRGAEDVWPDPRDLQRGFDGMPLIEADDRAAGAIPFFDDWVRHSTRDEYWTSIDGHGRAESLRSPVLLSAGWYDPFLPGQLDDFERIRASGRLDVADASRLIIGPWGHAEAVRLPGSPGTRNYRLDSLAPSLPWFDRHLRGMTNPRGQEPPVRLYVMGADVWRDEKDWPLARARDTIYYLQSSGRANGVSGDGFLTKVAPVQFTPADVFVSDPENPVPTRGGAMLGPGGGVALQDDVEMRQDVLVYTSPVLASPLEVTGRVKVVLYVSVSTASADFTAKLVDVHPDGHAYNVTDGILRRSFPPSENPESGDITTITIELWPTSMLFQQGHKIRLEIAGSNFPRFDRNPHTAEPAGLAATTTSSKQAVHHSSVTPSRVVLPAVPIP